MMKLFYVILLFSTINNFLFAQHTAQQDSLIKSMLNEQLTPEADKGLELIQTGNFSGASQFYSSEISKDESDRQAYFKRGVANWALSDTLSACRDWSAVLALGDTEMFNLLDSRCHGSMIISEDTIPSRQYRKMWATHNGVSEGQQAKTVVEIMPAFPGGDQSLFEYIRRNLKRPASGNKGTVYVNFLIDPKGKILFPYVTRGLDKVSDKEAVRLVKNMPLWSPGKQRGKAVYVRSNLPIRF